jgi:hypothetical protein
MNIYEENTINFWIYYRELVAINKENRLIPPGRKTRQAHNRSFQIPSSSTNSEAKI